MLETKPEEMVVPEPLRKVLGDPASEALRNLLIEIRKDPNCDVVVVAEEGAEPTGIPKGVDLSGRRVLLIPEVLREVLGPEPTEGLVYLINRVIEGRRRRLALFRGEFGTGGAKR